MGKGQIFSTDLLFAMVLIILALGALAGIAEFNNYNTKQKTIFSSLKEKSETAAITLTNAPWSSCKINEIPLAYSINQISLDSLISTPLEIKKRLALQDNNVQIVMLGIPETYYVNDLMLAKNVVTIDLNVVVCTNLTTYTDINSCMNSPALCNNTNFKTKTIRMSVGE